MNNNNVIQLSEETTLVFAPNEVNIILTALNELPRKISNDLIIKIERQLIAQQPKVSNGDGEELKAALKQIR